MKLIFYAKITPAGHRLAVRGAKVRFAGHTRKTNKHGRAIMRVKIKHAGHEARHGHALGAPEGHAKLRVRKRRRR